jgi:hypothetical protein
VGHDTKFVTKQGKKVLSKITPIISSDNIFGYQPKETRNYFTTPIPPLDDRLIVWELRRPLLQELPILPATYKNAWDQCNISGNDYASTHSHDIDSLSLAAMLADAKDWCIETIMSSLTFFSSNSSQQITLQSPSIPFLLSWLKQTSLLPFFSALVTLVLAKVMLLKLFVKLLLCLALGMP